MPRNPRKQPRQEKHWGPGGAEAPIQIKTRLPRVLHNFLKHSAEERQTPFNREIINRLWETIDARPRRSLEELAVLYNDQLARSAGMELQMRDLLLRLEQVTSRLEQATTGETK
jgi:hypothetical protein